MTTILTILDQDCLHIDSEMDLFLALVRYAEKHGHGKLICEYISHEDTDELLKQNRN